MADKIENDKELLDALRPAFQKACHYVAEKIYETNREIVQKVVYEAGDPSVYERTGEFLDAWAVTKDDFNKSKYSYAKFYYKHYAQHIGVSEPYYGRESKEYLAEIIYEGMAGPTFGHGYWTKKRNAWDALIKEIDKWAIRNWFEEAMEAQGVKLHRHRTTSIKFVED